MKILTAILLVLSFQCSFAQTKIDLGNMVAMSTSFSMKQKGYLSPRSYRRERGEGKSALYISSMIMGFAGGALMGYSITNNIMGRPVNDGPLITGIGLIAVAFPLYAIERRKNGGFSKAGGTPENFYATSKHKIKMTLAGGPNAVALVVRF